MPGTKEQTQGRSRFILGWTWAASLAVHGVLIGGFGWYAFRSLHEREQPLVAHAAPAPAAGGTIAIELPGVAEGSLLLERPPDPRGEPPTAAGGTTTARLDTGARGRGGDERVEAQAQNLADHDERMRLSPDLRSDLDRDQVQRLRVAAERESREDRRSTTHPTELTFLASGAGDRHERRASADADPSRGSALRASPVTRGGLAGTREQRAGADDARAFAGAARDGSTAAAAGLGVRDGRPGQDHRADAAVAFARPDVTLAAVSVPADLHGRPRDNIDSDQEVATTVRSLVHASTSGGIAGEGRGGSGGGGDPGAGGTFGFGAEGRPIGPGDSEWFDMSAPDPRLLPYFRRIHAKVDPLWANAFPKSALYDLKQGTVILEVTIAADGAVSVAWPPARPSGIDEFDRNCWSAVRRAGPFDPIPRELGRATLKVRMPFDAQNPIVK